MKQLNTFADIQNIRTWKTIHEILPLGGGGRGGEGTQTMYFRNGVVLKVLSVAQPNITKTAKL